VSREKGVVESAGRLKGREKRKSEPCDEMKIYEFLTVGSLVMNFVLFIAWILTGVYFVQRGWRRAGYLLTAGTGLVMVSTVAGVFVPGRPSFDAAVALRAMEFAGRIATIFGLFLAWQESRKE
jgi:hypothetical protein